MPARPPRRRAALGPVVLAALVAVGGLAGCGADEARTALAIDHLRPGADGTLVATTECADDLQVEVGPDHGGSALPEVVVWGRPRVGRCHPSVAVPGVTGTKVVDGTTSQVVAVEPS